MTRTVSERDALILDLETERMATRANSHATTTKDGRWNRIALGLRAIRRELRALMHDDDRSGT